MNDKVNIIIPMAGDGSRFNIAGYDTPKPFIKFNGKLMVEHVLSSFEKLNANFVLVMQEKFLKERSEEVNELKAKYSIKIATVPRLTMGAAITALAAHKMIDAQNDIIFADADNIFEKSDLSNFLNHVRINDLNGALITINSNNPCYSYAKINTDGYLVETKEKEVISNNAICGVYYFKDLNEFKDAIIEMIVCNDLSKGEFYMSNVYNYLIKISSKIGIYNIEHFDCVGTPEQLKKYMEDSQLEKV